MDEDSDILIAGGGPVGAAAALGLSRSGFRLALVEASVPGVASDDARTIALSRGTQLILDRLGVWPELAAAVTPITRILVSQQGGFGRAELSADDAGVPALGYVIRYAALQQVLSRALEAAGVRVMSGAQVKSVASDSAAAVATLADNRRLRARLIAIADGGTHLKLAHVRTRDYHQSAVVCDVVSEQSHQNRAFERFTPEGPLALLPHARGWSLVWTVNSPHAQELAALDERDFRARLQAAFGNAVGDFVAAGERRVFALALRYALKPVATRVLLIGNAAQTLHPVAGQGLNLGIRDAWELTRVIAARGADDPGKGELLNEYFSQRRFDRIATILFTDSLIRLFCKDIPLLNSLRGCGLAAFGATASAKNFLARRMMFGARG